MRFFALLGLCALSAFSQWLNYRTPGTPLAKNGKPNLAAPAPRSPDGHPDLSGTWMHEVTTVAEVRRLFGDRFDSEIELAPPGMEIGTQHKYVFNILLDFKPGEEPLRPEAAALMKQRAAERRPARVCTGFGSIPVSGLLSEAVKIIQAPRETLIMYEAGNFTRQIYNDGRKLPKQFDLPSYHGYSAGRWEGDTFVVETAGFNDKTALDGAGHPHGEQLRLTERFRRRDYGHLDWEMTFDDPQYYTKPFTVKIPHDLLPDDDIFEMYCENERDAAHLPQR